MTSLLSPSHPEPMEWARDIEIDAYQVSDYESLSESGSDDEDEVDSKDKVLNDSDAFGCLKPLRFNFLKKTQVIESSERCVGTGHTQGSRDSMEDTITVQRDLCTQAKLFVGVYDGHGGSGCISELLSNRLHEVLKTEIERANMGPEQIMKTAYSNFDLELLEAVRRQEQLGTRSLAKMKRTKSTIFDGTNTKHSTPHGFLAAGSTATTVVFSESPVDNVSYQYSVAWVGDSRAVLSKSRQAVALTVDHDPSDPNEYQRIIKNGGIVDKLGRLNRAINVSRAFGSFAHKSHELTNKQTRQDDLNLQLNSALSVLPDVVTRPVEESDDFIIVASDGVWTVLSNQEAVDVVSRSLEQSGSPEEAAHLLVEAAVVSGSKDNISAVVVLLEEFKSND